MKLAKPALASTAVVSTAVAARQRPVGAALAMPAEHPHAKKKGRACGPSAGLEACDTSGTAAIPRTIARQRKQAARQQPQACFRGQAERLSYAPGRRRFRASAHFSYLFFPSRRIPFSGNDASHAF
jgi:hypothetical protein